MLALRNLKHNQIKPVKIVAYLREPNGFKKTKSLRQPSNKKTGGQVGHQGSTLKMVKDPDLVVTHHPKTCQGCGCCLGKR